MAVVFDPPREPPAEMKMMYTEYGPVEYNAALPWRHKGAKRVLRKPRATAPNAAHRAPNPLTPNVAVSGVEHFQSRLQRRRCPRRIRKWIEELLS